ncbi:MAG: hypothetical protein KAG62_11570 [Caulobacter sp.]|nr:hypothetical protein [Caulobacter sp.]
MMNCMAMMGGPMGSAMMLAGGVLWLLLLALTVLGIVALVRHLRAPRA